MTRTGCRRQILKSLKSNRYMWRSIDGIVKETKFSTSEVKNQISVLKNEGLIIQSSKPDKKGRELYALKEKYFSKKNIVSMMISAFADQVK